MQHHNVVHRPPHHQRYSPRGNWWLVFWGWSVALVIVCSDALCPFLPVVCGQEEEVEKPLYQQQPFDVLVLKRDGSRHKVLPLDVPGRKFRPQSSGHLQFRFVHDPSEEYAVRWSDIERIEFFEELVLAEARRLIAAQKFDEAFRHLILLLDRYPQTEGLEATVQDYLFARAANDAGEGRWSEALAGLEELYRRNNEYQGMGGRRVIDALQVTTETVLMEYVRQGQYRTARRLLARFTATYGEERLPTLANVRQRLIELATEKARQARQLLQSGKLAEAQQVSLQVLTIWPKLEGGIELVRETVRRYPIVKVGVAERVRRAEVSAIDDWAGRRAGRLVGRSLVEYAGPGAEGGRYTSPLGSLQKSDDYRQLWWQLRASSTSPPSGITAYDMVRLLLTLAHPQSPHYRPGWADMLDSARADGLWRVEVNLRRPCVVPEAALRLPLSGDVLPQELLDRFQPYLLGEQTDKETLFVRNPRLPADVGTPPAEIRERFYEDTRDALDDLQRGEILVLDRVFPADVAPLLSGQREGQIVVRPYSVPVLHLIVPKYSHPYVKNAAFRRALLHGIPRTAILERLYGGKPLDGCRVLSGPFPAPRSADDASAYAYDTRLSEQPFDPGLTMLLTGIAKQQLATEAEKKMEEPPELTPLVLAYPDDAVARFVCTIIAEQWQKLQIPCQLRPLRVAADISAADYDLRYVTVIMEEPLVDAARLLGRGGLAESPSPYVQLAVRRALEATTWRDVRTRMQELHQLVYADASVLPLFQTVEYYAYNKNLNGIGEEIATLYQEVENWQIEPVVLVDE